MNFIWPWDASNSLKQSYNVLLWNMTLLDLTGLEYPAKPDATASDCWKTMDVWLYTAPFSYYKVITANTIHLLLIMFYPQPFTAMFLADLKVQSVGFSSSQQ